MCVYVTVSEEVGQHYSPVLYTQSRVLGEFLSRWADGVWCVVDSCLARLIYTEVRGVQI